MTLAEQVRRIRKGRSAVIKAGANVAKVTAHRALGRGKYSVASLSPKRTKVTRVK